MQAWFMQKLTLDYGEQLNVSEGLFKSLPWTSCKPAWTAT